MSSVSIAPEVFFHKFLQRLQWVEHYLRFSGDKAVSFLPGFCFTSEYLRSCVSNRAGNMLVTV